METGIYGWQGRLGYTAPSPLLNTPHEFWRLAPEGIAMVSTGLHVTRLFNDDADHVEQEIVDAAAALDPFGLDYISVGLAPLVFQHGSVATSDLRGKIGLVASAPIFFDCEAIVESFHSLRAHRLSVLSPYSPATNHGIEKYLRSNGFEIAQIVSHEVESDVVEAGHLIGSIASEISKTPADAIYIAGDRWPIAKDVSALERELSVPIVTEAQALLWLFLRRMQIRRPLANCGQLLASCP
jgi:maleate cis-trans isomerase